ncbi:Astacin-like metallopeptidase domain,Peptidase, metallopeptidase,Peptidase M12A,Metallopeptidase [Cinara cedri]|uniref:Metalloendopeptidase n=1 Tax=Cinara cedri TaxID=506608 RepID=A0A5E4NCA1_9HEMI|nr:Astacin-like metallopeptidase domain,Peptidase, metallopeptidase,Peptidase M12A,Metallopeptidase [Cinara cedri]
MYGRDVLYAYAAANLLAICSAGLDGTFFGAMYDRFKEDLPTTFTPDMYPELKSRLYQGDIMLPVSRNAIISEYYKWPKAVVPYTIHFNFTSDERSKIRLAMDAIESRTCVRFVDKNNSAAVAEVGHAEYLYIVRERTRGCYAMIGYHQNFGSAHTMNLESPSCLTHQGTIQHELLHVLGLLHEQARRDRDNAVIIYWENIDKTYWPDFNKVPDNVTTTFGLPYDYTSVMHYPRYAFSKNGKETIVAKHDTSMKLGQRAGATVNDLRKINAMYNCNMGEHYQRQSDDYSSPLYIL